jgi:hypothetical protein
MDVEKFGVFPKTNLSMETLFKANQLEESEKYAAIDFKCSPEGSSKDPDPDNG